MVRDGNNSIHINMLSSKAQYHINYHQKYNYIALNLIMFKYNHIISHNITISMSHVTMTCACTTYGRLAIPL